ncbi:MAG: tetratricopeptide repeat protein, partial [Desulfoprunum sp.]|nr:tetratricopeptide repeat protein [Desulfoprunum sp.]
LDANPEDGAYWLHYIDALAQAGRIDSARQILEVAKGSGLQGAEVDALSTRLAALPDNTSVGQSDLAEKECTREDTKKNNRQKRPKKASSSRQRASEPRADEIEKLAAFFTQGRYEEAETLARSMARRFPEHGFAWKVLGPILKQQGRAVEALLAMKQAVVLLPHDYGTHYNLGISYQDQEKYDEAEACYRRALELNPAYVEAYHNLGNTLNALGRIAEAESSLRLAIKLESGFAEAYNDLGNLLKGQGRLMEAQEHYRLALKQKPDFVIAYSNLGNILKDQGNLVDAEDCYRNALKLKPNFAEVHYNLGNTLRLRGSLAESEACLRRALEINPHFTEAHNNLGVCLKEQGLIEEAEKSYNRALQLNPNYAEAYSNLGSILNIKGSFFEAENSFRSALELKPDYENAISNLLFLMNYHPDKTSEEIYEEYKRYNARFGLPLQKDWRPHANRKEKNRRLKVGYVSGDYNKHSVRHFLEPLFAHHNKEAVELYAYAEIMVEDTVTARYKEKADHWIPTVGMTDTELAERIRSDAIDILVELSGHTAKNRLGVFARKPAPVSVSWMGYGYTTGLTAIDYFLTDATIVPEGSEGLFAETPWRLTTPSCAYRPAEGMGEVSPLPARQRGYVTFGTLTRAVRINHLTIRVWSEILKRVAGSHLVINSGNFKDSKMRSLMLEKFTAQGIEEERLEIGCNSPPWDVLRAMDIGLDCFPHNSGTTLFENLYMGVPFVTLAGRVSAGRLGASILEGVGHGEWIAWTEEEYIERAVSLAMDLPRLEKLRAGLRGEMESGPLMDEAGFVGRVEAAYGEMFGKWCEGKK